MNQKLIIFLLSVFSMSAIAATQMASDRISDIRNTKHNFASLDEPQLPSGVRTVKAATENQVCVFCHTPHGDPLKVSDRKHFLWNRSLSSVSDKYTSSSMQAITAAPGTSSKMCLSCHDGTVAIGQVDVNNGRSPATEIVMDTNGTEATGQILSSSNANLGTDLTNDHPIGFVYNDALATNVNENELRSPSSTPHIGIRVGGSVANFNAGIADGSETADNPVSAITRIAVPLESVASFRTSEQASFVSVAAEGTVECTTCHDPHIRSTDTTENIKFLRLHRFQKTDPVDGNFLINSDINCLACHKKSGWAGSAHASEAVAPHIYTTDEADKREISPDKAVWQTSCIACHDTHTETDARWLLRKTEDASVGAELSDVDKSCYECHSSNSVLAASNTVADIQSVALLGGHADFTFTSGNTAHRPINADLEESSTDLQVRHAVCSDCHNPHRIVKGLHVNNSAANNNQVSGALTGVSGLNASDSSGSFNPYGDEDSAVPIKIATEEYQICFKCHSTYGHGTANINSATFSNTVMEFSSDPALLSAHPVINSGSNPNITADLLESPFKTDVNVQTMYCSDCHTNTDGLNVPIAPQGSHNNDVAACETCHVSEQYNFVAGVTPLDSGFACINAGACNTEAGPAGNSNNLHIFHASKIAGNKNICSNCHVKVSHGWKNKALLANLNDAVNPLVTDVRYYGDVNVIDGAKSLINIMQPSGQWTKISCGSAGGCH